jgi:hypothetical protein
VPEQTKRTCSAQGTASTIASASAMPWRLLAKKVVPSGTCACTAAVTSGWAWPMNIGPEPSRKSTYSLAGLVDDPAALTLLEDHLGRHVAEAAARQDAAGLLDEVVGGVDRSLDVHGCLYAIRWERRWSDEAGR